MDCYNKYCHIIFIILLFIILHIFNLPYLACILITNKAVYPATKAITSPIIIDAISPDCLIPQGTESKDVPIMVFQMAKLQKRTIYIEMV